MRLFIQWAYTCLEGNRSSLSGRELLSAIIPEIVGGCHSFVIVHWCYSHIPNGLPFKYDSYTHNILPGVNQGTGTKRWRRSEDDRKLGLGETQQYDGVQLINGILTPPPSPILLNKYSANK